MRSRRRRFCFPAPARRLTRRTTKETRRSTSRPFTTPTGWPHCFTGRGRTTRRKIRRGKPRWKSQRGESIRSLCRPRRPRRKRRLRREWSYTTAAGFCGIWKRRKTCFCGRPTTDTRMRKICWERFTMNGGVDGNAFGAMKNFWRRAARMISGFGFLLDDHAQRSEILSDRMNCAMNGGKGLPSTGRRFLMRAGMRKFGFCWRRREEIRLGRRIGKHWRRMFLRTIGENTRMR